MVENAVKACIPCQASYPGPNKREPICPTSLPKEPWSEVAIDFAGPFPSGQYLLVVLDEHSRFPEVEIIPSTSAKSVIPRLSSIFARQGYPKVVKSDNGPPFQGQEFADFSSVCGFKHRRITPLWPEANGCVERFMGTLNKSIRASVADNRDWKAELDGFLMHYRATPHSATHISPFEALTGRKMNMGIPHIPKSEPTPVTTRMVQNDARSKSKMKDQADKKRHTAPSSLSPGSQVLIKQRKLNKLTPPYDPKPFTVLEKHGSMVIAERNGHNLTRNSSFFRPVNVKPSFEEEEEDKLSNDEPAEIPEGKPNECSPNDRPSHTIPKSEYNPRSPVASPRRNPPRNAGKPQKFKDFVM